VKQYKKVFIALFVFSIISSISAVASANTSLLANNGNTALVAVSNNYLLMSKQNYTYVESLKFELKINYNNATTLDIDIHLTLSYKAINYTLDIVEISNSPNPKIISMNISNEIYITYTDNISRISANYDIIISVLDDFNTYLQSVGITNASTILLQPIPLSGVNLASLTDNATILDILQNWHCLCTVTGNIIDPTSISFDTYSDSGNSTTLGIAVVGVSGSIGITIFIAKRKWWK